MKLHQKYSFHYRWYLNFIFTYNIIHELKVYLRVLSLIQTKREAWKDLHGKSKRCASICPVAVAHDPRPGVDLCEDGYTVLGVEADLVGVEEVAEDLHDEADQQQRAPGLVQPHRQPVARVLLGPRADGPPQQRVPSTDIVN